MKAARRITALARHSGSSLHSAPTHENFEFTFAGGTSIPGEESILQSDGPIRLRETSRDQFRFGGAGGLRLIYGVEANMVISPCSPALPYCVRNPG